MPRFMAGFGLFWTVLVFLGTFPEWIAGRWALENGTAAVVEGPVENFVPMPEEGHAEESFTVHGVPFHYSDFNMTSAFRNTRSHGGPIRAGVHVRIHYRGNAILKLEISKE